MLLLDNFKTNLLYYQYINKWFWVFVKDKILY